MQMPCRGLLCKVGRRNEEGNTQEEADNKIVCMKGRDRDTEGVVGVADRRLVENSAEV
jgi:hypothetical protein